MCIGFLTIDVWLHFTASCSIHCLSKMWLWKQLTLFNNAHCCEGVVPMCLAVLLLFKHTVEIFDTSNTVISSSVTLQSVCVISNSGDWSCSVSCSVVLVVVVYFPSCCIDGWCWQKETFSRPETFNLETQDSIYLKRCLCCSSHRLFSLVESTSKRFQHNTGR